MADFGPGEVPGAIPVSRPGSAAEGLGSVYTRRIHPQIWRAAPGKCPFCGMTLDCGECHSGVRGTSPEWRDMTRRFWVGTTLAGPVQVPMSPCRAPG